MITKNEPNFGLTYSMLVSPMLALIIVPFPWDFTCYHFELKFLVLAKFFYLPLMSAMKKKNLLIQRGKDEHIIEKNVALNVISKEKFQILKFMFSIE